jgi:hypothetical protein
MDDFDDLDTWSDWNVDNDEMEKQIEEERIKHKKYRMIHLRKKINQLIDHQLNDHFKHFNYLSDSLSQTYQNIYQNLQLPKQYVPKTSSFVEVTTSFRHSVWKAIFLHERVCHPHQYWNILHNSPKLLIELFPIDQIDYCKFTYCHNIEYWYYYPKFENHPIDKKIVESNKFHLQVTFYPDHEYNFENDLFNMLGYIFLTAKYFPNEMILNENCVHFISLVFRPRNLLFCEEKTQLYHDDIRNAYKKILLYSSHLSYVFPNSIIKIGVCENYKENIKVLEISKNYKLIVFMILMMRSLKNVPQGFQNMYGIFGVTNICNYVFGIFL